MALLPRDEKFFDELEAQAAVLSAAVLQMHPRVEGLSEVIELRTLRQQSGAITVRVIEALQTAFIPPLDRSDLHQLVLRLDRVAVALDWADFTGRLGATETAALEALLASARAAVDSLAAAIGELRHRKEHERARDRCRELKRLEGRAQDQLRAAVSLRSPATPNWPQTFATAQALAAVSSHCDAAADAVQAALFNS